MNDNKFIKLKYLAKSFSSTQKQSEVLENGQFKVFGASGFVGFLNNYGYHEEYIGIVKDGAGVGRTNIYEAYSSLLGTMAYIIPLDKENIDLRFLRYSIDALNLSTKAGDNSTIPHIYFSDYGNELILNISIIKQKTIAEFITSKLKDVNEYISIQEKQIEKLKEYKQSVISKAVTKGLNPNMSMKYSGIEWIGDIPNHYEIRKLKTCLIEKLQYGANSSGVAYDENLPRYIRITDITLDNELKDDGKLSLPIEEANNYILKDGDVLFARSGATVGKTFLFKEEYGYSAFAGYLIKASTDRSVLLPQYLYYFTLTSAYAEWVKQIFIQATIQNIGANKYSNLLLTVPSIEEQSNICDYLATIDKKFKHLEAVLQQKISKLIEYKESLIYEYVTGKKEVA